MFERKDILFITSPPIDDLKWKYLICVCVLMHWLLHTHDLSKKKIYCIQIYYLPKKNLLHLHYLLARLREVTWLVVKIIWPYFLKWEYLYIEKSEKKKRKKNYIIRDHLICTASWLIITFYDFWVSSILSQFTLT